MKYNKIIAIFSLFFFKSTLCIKYSYITNEGIIQTGVTNQSVIPRTNNTVAVVIYENNVNKSGWANLELQTFDGFTDEDQSYKAGYLEGYITGELIHMSFKNLFQDLCSGNETFCRLLKDFVKKNNDFVNEMIERNKNSDYWHQLDLIYRQINGLQSGYQLWKSHNNQTNDNIDEDFLSEVFLLNLDIEISSLRQALTPETARPYDGHCSAIVKPLADGSDLFVSHSTWSNYNTMLRVIKKYSFAFKSLNTSKPIAGHSVSFSSYPGTILSTDDYYVLSSGLVVLETTIESFNKSLNRFISADNIVFEFARNIIANRLADSGKQWTQLFGQYNSGTYNNQFMIIDYKLFKRFTRITDLPNHVLWVIEQMPGLIVAEDLTHILREQGYWASYNVAYFPKLSEWSGEINQCRTQGSYYCWSSTPRARIFRRDESKVTDLKTLYSLMRYNDFRRDPLSECQLYLYNKTCIPPYSADLSIAARNDLNDPKGVYPLHFWTHRGEGAIDAKIVNADMVRSLEMIAVSGPTDRQQPPFQWSTSGLTDRHSGHPDLFEFKPIQVKWFPNSYENITEFN